LSEKTSTSPQLYHYPTGCSSVTQIGLEVPEIPYEVLVDLSVGAPRKDPYLTAPAHVFAGGADRCAEQACVRPVSTPDSVALKIGVHLNHISVWSYALFGISLVLLGVVRANGAVIAPLIILAVSLLGVRFPLALALLDGPAR
jgi:hypothetical protein